jgi:3' exoribonuclease, RNase T-like
MSKITRHVILDLETLSTRPDAAILQIGAVCLDSEGNKLREFEATMGQDIAGISAKRYGRHVSVDTLIWWEGQSIEARNSAFYAVNGERLDYKEAMLAFCNWFNYSGIKKETAVWGRGPDFDNVILASSIEAVGLELPWHYPNNRCLRTLMDIANLNPKDISRSEDEIEHTALGDARFEARLFKYASLEFRRAQ